MDDPKNFMNKLKQLTGLEVTGDKNGNENKETSVDKEVKKMDKKMHKMLQG